jgi:hypothetical protein
MLTVSKAYMELGSPAGIGATGGGYLQTVVITSSPSNSRPGWKRTTMLLVNTRIGSYENTAVSKREHSHGEGHQWWGCHGGRVTTHDGDDLVAIHLKARVEAHHNIVCEYPLRILLKQNRPSAYTLIIQAHSGKKLLIYFFIYCLFTYILICLFVCSLPINFFISLYLFVSFLVHLFLFS